MNAPTHQGQRTAHLDTAGTGRMPAAVQSVLADCTARDDRFGPHALEEELGAVLHTGIHERLGALLGVPAGRTALAVGAADAFHAYVSRLDLGPRDRIWTTPHEGVARLTTLHALRERTRCRLEVVPLRADGDLDLEWMLEHIDEDVALVSVVHVSAVCGTVNPVEAVGRLLAPHRALYAVDASHAVGQLPVDAARIGCDLLTADGWRFLRGPQGIGFAYAGPRSAEAFPEPPAPAAVAALYTALGHHAAAMSLPHPQLLPRLRSTVARAPGIDLLAAGRVQAGIVGFRHGEVPAALVRRALARRGIVVRKSVAQEHPLHPAGREAPTALVASVHYDNTAEDIDHLGPALREALHEIVREERKFAAVSAVRVLAAAGAAPVGRPPVRQDPYRRPEPFRRGHLTLHTTS
ncbi:aminotransferase class V-fold PLP-dependent enzyme [Streptomyces sp. NPDC006326]|uniref:aminotransferase class V-fold PLP-dependent enzyme n=1 Tax=Streptomyces sp. NPDC006326 TaxID=3156752 RepID=UPI0033B98110